MIPAVPVRPQRPSPLTQMGIAPGHYYDIHTGLVKPSGSPAPTPTTTRVDQQPSTLCSKCSEHECICNDGVYVNGKRQADPKRPGDSYIRNL